MKPNDFRFEIHLFNIYQIFPIVFYYFKKYLSKRSDFFYKIHFRIRNELRYWCDHRLWFLFNNYFDGNFRWLFQYLVWVCFQILSFQKKSNHFVILFGLKMFSFLRYFFQPYLILYILINLTPKLNHHINLELYHFYKIHRLFLVLLLQKNNFNHYNQLWLTYFFLLG